MLNSEAKEFQEVYLLSQHYVSMERKANAEELLKSISEILLRSDRVKEGILFMESKIKTELYNTEDFLCSFSLGDFISPRYLTPHQQENGNNLIDQMKENFDRVCSYYDGVEKLLSDLQSIYNRASLQIGDQVFRTKLCDKLKKALKKNKKHEEKIKIEQDMQTCEILTADFQKIQGHFLDWKNKRFKGGLIRDFKNIDLEYVSE
eukprot:Pgem_evm1s19427